MKQNRGNIFKQEQINIKLKKYKNEGYFRRQLGFLVYNSA